MGVINFLSKPIISWLNREPTSKARALSDFERIKYELKMCDVILIEGRSRVSDVIRITTQSPWTHAGLYIGRLHDVEDPDLRKIIGYYYQGDPGDRLVIESLLGHGTIVRNLNVYEEEHLRICRPARLGIKNSHMVVKYAVSRLGVEYDVRQIFDLARFLFPWSFLPRRWRSSLFRHNAGRSTRTVCSTMIAEAFAFVQFPILPLVKLSEKEEVQMFRRNPKLCTPSDFDYSPYFKIIKYPFIDIRYHEEHHLLPWIGDGALNENETDIYMIPGSSPSLESVEQAICHAVALSENLSGEGCDAAAVEMGVEAEPTTDADVNRDDITSTSSDSFEPQPLPDKIPEDKDKPQVH